MQCYITPAYSRSQWSRCMEWTAVFRPAEKWNNSCWSVSRGVCSLLSEGGNPHRMNSCRTVLCEATTPTTGCDVNKNTMEDILQICLHLEIKLPAFHATDLSWTPPVDADHCDISIILQELQSLRAEVRVEEILLINEFFRIVDTCLSCKNIAWQSYAMVPRWRIFGNFLRPVFSASCVTCILNSY